MEKINQHSGLFRLDGKIALVTGGGSGIGAAIAQLFYNSGAQVIVVDCDDKGGMAMAQKLFPEFPERCFYSADVSNVDSVQAMAERVLADHQKVDVLVNNAGIGHVGTTLETEAADLDRLYAVNVRGVFNVTKAFLPGMLERKSGSVIQLASIGGVVGIVDRLAYCTTKFAVVGMTKCMALDHAKQGVRINCICPGRVETPFVSARLKEYPDPEKAYRDMSASQAMGRMGQPEEIAASALYLASDASSFITGHAHITDGGWSAGHIVA